MQNSAIPNASPWHAGEKQLQTQVGVAERMEMLGSRTIRDYLPEQHREFYNQLPFVLLGAVDADGQPWATLLEGEPGFVDSPEPNSLHIAATVSASDPLADVLNNGAAVGLLGIELHTRRRNRMNGRLAGVDADGMSITVEQSFGNCPRYIQLREVESFESAPLPSPGERSAMLDTRARRLIEQADTFFVASYVDLPDGSRAVDVSHRGGKPGFILVKDQQLTIPDFAGNNYFNTLGNLLLNPRAGLLFIDFTTGDVLQLSGRTTLTMDGDAAEAFLGAERLWHLHVEQVVWRSAAARLRWQFYDYAPESLLTGNWVDAI